MQICPHCGEFIREFWKICEQCGSRFKVGKERKFEARFCSHDCKAKHDKIAKQERKLERAAAKELRA